MKKLPIPKGWVVDIKPPVWRMAGVYGYHWTNLKRIEIYPRKWWFGVRQNLTDLTLQHELGHAWGIKGCKKPWCLMFEAQTWSEPYKDVWWERVLGMTTAVNFFRFCKKHRDYLEEQIQSD